MLAVGTPTEAFTVLRELYRDGMGVVYLAEDRDLGDHCAIKLLDPLLAQDDAMVVRFRNEARTAAAIKHGAVAKLRRSATKLADGSWYYSMEYLEGSTLTEFCARHGGPLPLALILQIIGPICEAIDLAHAAGVIHGDLNPDNLIVAQRAGVVSPKLLNIGVARFAGDPETAHALDNARNAAFVAPEQASGGKVDRRGDIYSLGVMVFQMVTGGSLPYGAEGHRQAMQPPIDLRQWLPDVPDAARAAISSAIQLDATRRPITAGMFVLMLASAHADGVSILRACAPDLFRRSDLDETLRTPGPRARQSVAVPSWKYEYGAPLGKGGMAEVVRATMLGADGFRVPLAIKRILPEFARAPQFVEMFQQEARIAALLAHPNVVRVLDHNVDPEGRLYLAMEFVDGVDLDKLRKTGLIPHSIAIFVVSEILEGLEYAHHLPTASALSTPEELAARAGVRGIVHRDLSHHNVMISWQGAVKVMDFGIAKLRAATIAAGSAMLKGKPAYMSPEQANTGVALDGRSDLFAVGTMLWELLTGYALFDRETLEQVLCAVLLDPIPRPSVVNSEVPEDLERVTMKLLERNPDARYQTAQEAILALHGCIAASRTAKTELKHLLLERFPSSAARPQSKVLPAVTSSRSERVVSAVPHPRQEERGSARTTPDAPRALLRDGQARGSARRSLWGLGALVFAILIAGVSTALIKRNPQQEAPGARADVRAGAASLHAPAPSPTAVEAKPPATAAIAEPRPPVTAPATASPSKPAAEPRPAAVAPAVASPNKPVTTAVEPKPPATAAEPKPPAVAGPGKPTSLGPVNAQERGELAIVVKPWAMVSINGRPAGQTPYHHQLPIGVYRVRLVNDNADMDETITVTVSREHTTTIERTWGKR